MKEEQQQKNQLLSYINKMEQQRQERRKNTKLKLSKESPFIRESPNQQFYRQIVQLQQKEFNIRKLGWKITEVEKHQEDLILFCFNLLTSTLLFPLNIFTNSVQNNDETYTKSLWMEVTIHSSDQSMDIYSVEENIEVKAFHLVEQKLLVLFRSFINEQLDWCQMIKQENSSQKIIDIFEAKVIAVANKIISNDLTPK